MFFHNPILLIGLSAAVIPLVLHLLSRARFCNVDWGAMMFLGRPEVHQRQSTKLKQWTLLGLRMATISLLAMALARPAVRGRPPQGPRPSRAAAVVLFDRSASMALNDNGRARLEMAREAVLQILPGLNKGDDLWLVPMGDPLKTGDPHATDPQELSERVKEIGTAAGTANIADSLRKALGLLEGVGSARGEIYIVCDHQAASWAGVDLAFIDEFRARAARLPVTPRVFVIPVGTDESDNVAIESVELIRTPAVVGQVNRVEVRIHNYAATPRAAVEVKVGQNSVPVNLPARSTSAVQLPVAFYDNGPQLLTAEISAGGLAFDKRFELAVEVLRDLRVLIIDGDEHEGAFRSESDFLRLALAPYRARLKDLAVVEVVSPEDFAGRDLSSYQVVILTNVGQVDLALARSLEQFVYSGGGLLVAPGDRSRSDNYNDRLFRDGDGILPAELQPAIPESDATVTSVGHLELSHPIFAFLRNRVDPAPPAAVRRYFPITPRDYGVTILASYTDGRPFLLESQSGRGRVLLMTTSVDIDWNSLALTNFFLPFAQSAVRHLAEGRLPRLSVAPGEPLIADIDEPADTRKMAIRVPNLEPRRTDARDTFADPGLLSLSPSGTRLHVRFDQTQAAGVYRILGKRGDAKPLAMFVVRTPAIESDLSPLSENRWKELEASLGFSRVEADRRTIAVAQDVARGGWHLWIALVPCVIIVSLAELTLARRWSGAMA